MPALLYTDTNAANDSGGRAFGLDGNLYLPVLITVVGSLAGFSLFVWVFELPLMVAVAMIALPLLAVLAWVIGLRRGKPAGYDRDFVECLWNGGHFTRNASDQKGLLP